MYSTWAMICTNQFCGLWGSDSSEESELGSRLEGQATKASRGGIHCHRVHSHMQVLTVHEFTTKFTHMACICPSCSVSHSQRLDQGPWSLQDGIALLFPSSAFVYSWFLPYSSCLPFFSKYASEPLSQLWPSLHFLPQTYQIHNIWSSWRAAVNMVPLLGKLLTLSQLQSPGAEPPGSCVQSMI